MEVITVTKIKLEKGSIEDELITYIQDNNSVDKVIPQKLPKHILKKAYDDYNELRDEITRLKKTNKPLLLILSILSSDYGFEIKDGYLISEVPQSAIKRGVHCIGISVILEVLNNNNEIRLSQDSFPTIENILDFEREIKLNITDNKTKVDFYGIFCCKICDVFHDIELNI